VLELCESTGPLIHKLFIVAPQTVVSDVIKMVVRYNTGPVLIKDGVNVKGIFTEVRE